MRRATVMREQVAAGVTPDGTLTVGRFLNRLDVHRRRPPGRGRARTVNDYKGALAHVINSLGTIPLAKEEGKGYRPERGQVKALDGRGADLGTSPCCRRGATGAPPPPSLRAPGHWRAMARPWAHLLLCGRNPHRPGAPAPHLRPHRQQGRSGGCRLPVLDASQCREPPPRRRGQHRGGGRPDRRLNNPATLYRHYRHKTRPVATAALKMADVLGA